MTPALLTRRATILGVPLAGAAGLWAALTGASAAPLIPGRFTAFVVKGESAARTIPAVTPTVFDAAWANAVSAEILDAIARSGSPAGPPPALDARAALTREALRR